VNLPDGRCEERRVRLSPEDYPLLHALLRSQAWIAARVQAACAIDVQR